MGPLGSVADSMREIHLALAISCSPLLHHTCHSKNTPLLINQALGTMLTAHSISLVSFNDCIEIIKAESEYQNTQLKNSIKQVWNCKGLHRRHQGSLQVGTPLRVSQSSSPDCEGGSKSGGCHPPAPLSPPYRCFWGENETFTVQCTHF